MAGNRISKRILDDIARECDSGEMERIIRRIRYMRRQGVKKLLAEGGARMTGPNAKPEGSVLLEGAVMAARAEEAIQGIRERQLKVATTAEALIAGLYSKITEQGPRVVVNIVEASGDAGTEAQSPPNEGASSDPKK